MQNYTTAKTKDIFISKLNSLNLVALAVFFFYFFSIALLPVGNSIVSVRQSNLAASQNKNNSFYLLQAAKASANTATEITTTTYIDNGLMLARQIDNNNLQSYINDAKGSVLKLNSADDKSQDQIYNYDAYGKPIANTIKPNPVLNVLNSFQYNGERFDNNTALQYLRARFYNPEIKRFVNQDSYSLLNRFAYVDANPVMITDPTGHESFTGWLKDNWNSGGWQGKLIDISIAAAGIAVTGALVAGVAYFGRRKSPSRAFPAVRGRASSNTSYSSGGDVISNYYAPSVLGERLRSEPLASDHVSQEGRETLPRNESAPVSDGEALLSASTSLAENVLSTSGNDVANQEGGDNPSGQLGSFLTGLIEEGNLSRQLAQHEKTAEELWQERKNSIMNQFSVYIKAIDKDNYDLIKFACEECELVWNEFKTSGGRTILNNSGNYETDKEKRAICDMLDIWCQGSLSIT